MKYFILLLCATACLASPRPTWRFLDPPKARTCGTPAIKPDTTTDIIGGKDAIPYSWPWQVVLCRKPLIGKACSLTCGGSLISNQWIISAGHCFGAGTTAKQYGVKLGVYDQTKTETGEIVVDISEFHVHPKFKLDPTGKTPPTFDISIAKLANPVQFTDHISPVCLPEPNDKDLPSAGSTTFLTGWGRTRNSNQAPVNPTLKQVSVPLVAAQTCNDFINQIGSTGDWSNEIVCFGNPQGGKSSCNGDSGGPAVYQDPANSNQWTQIGITSFGLSNATGPCSGQYSAYGRIGSFLDFVKQYEPNYNQ